MFRTEKSKRFQKAGTRRKMSKSKNRNLSHAAPTSSMRVLDKKMKPPDKNNNNPSASSSGRTKESLKKSKDYEKYSLRPRSIQNRIETEKRQKGELKKEPKPKQKPPPLSKYRRKTANARERSRMREINTAYELLQKAVPQYPVLPTNSQGKTCEKLTKITTLRLAMNYIQTLQSMLNQSEDGGGRRTISSSLGSLLNIGNTDAESDTDSVANSVASSSSLTSSISSPCVGSSGNNNVNSNSLGSGSEFSPASSYTMSPLSSCSPVGPDCIQTVMRSVVSPAAAAAISANAANLNNLNLNNVSLSSLTNSPASLGIVPPHQSITTIVTIPSHPHAQAQYSRQLPPNIQQHHNLHNHQQQQQQSQPQIQQLHHYHALPPPPRPAHAASTSSSSVSSSATYISPTAMTSSSTIILQPQPVQHYQKPIQISSMLIPQSQRNPLLCSAQPPILVSSSNSNTNRNNNNGNSNNNTLAHALAPGSNKNNAGNLNVISMNMGKTKLPPIATSLSSALLRKSMSSFLTDCIQLTNGVSVSMNNINNNNNSMSINGSNNGHRTGSLSSLTESDFSEYTNDLLSDEGSVLDEPMFEDIIGVGTTDLDSLLGSEAFGFPTADLNTL